jgi:hypothetical protein
MNNKRKASPAPEPRKPRRPDEEGDDLLAWLRVSRKGGRLPQGCTPAEKRAALEALAEMHGVRPIEDPAAMAAEFWPDEETADEIMTALRALRRQRA